MKIKAISLLISTVALTSCATNNTQLGQPPAPALDLTNIDVAVRPQDDLFHFVNGQWLKTTQIPADKVRWGAFEELNEQTEENSLAILNKLITQPAEAGSEAHLIQQLYAAYMDWGQRNALGIEPIKPQLAAIERIKDVDGLASFLAASTLTESFNPLYSWTVFADLNDSKQNAVYFAGPDLGLPKDYFQKDTPHNQQVLKKYTEYVASLFQRLGYSAAKAQQVAIQVVAFEKQLAQVIWTNEQERDPNLMNYPVATKQLTDLVKYIDLAKYLTQVKVNTAKVIILEKQYYQQLDKFINPANVELLKDFLCYKTIAGAVSLLDEDLDKQAFAFYQQYLLDQKEPKAMNKRALALINTTIGEAFGKLYVKEYFPASSKQQIVELIDYLRQAFTQHIGKLAWMSATTKQKAQAKLAQMSVKVGYPNKWEDYSQIKVNTGDSLTRQLNAVSRWQYNKELAKVGQEVDKTKWSMPPQTVNAYYNPLFNEIVFPAAILQPPFFNPAADPAVNFGAIGAVIGHEMTHGFDDSGANYDASGNLVNWWSKQDKQQFDKVTKQLAEQYSKFEPIKDNFVNGIFTLGENIADLGGLNIAHTALNHYLADKGGVAAIDGYTQDQRFFMSWATVWRIKSTEKYLINQLKADPHSPGIYRVLGVVANVDAFAQAFKVQVTDKLFKKPQDRIKIW